MQEQNNVLQKTGGPTLNCGFIPFIRFFFLQKDYWILGYIFTLTIAAEGKATLLLSPSAGDFTASVRK
jgi:hypothetical protein